MRNSLRLGGLVALAGQSLAAIDCSGEFILTNASIVRDVRENCRTIEGRVLIPHNYTGDLNLDGVETILGGIGHNNCGQADDSDDDECVLLSSEPWPFTLSSDTLTELGGLFLRAPNALSRVALPNLRSVNGSVRISQARHLVELDLSGLKYVTAFELDAPRLETFNLDGLEGFIRPTGPQTNVTVNLVSVGNVTSVDGIFKNDLDPLQTETWDGPLRLVAGNNLTNMTLGWSRVPGLIIDGGWDNGLNVTLGGPNTTSMHIESLKLENFSLIERAPTLESLSVGTFRVSGYSLREFELPFDNVSEVHIHFPVGSFDSLFDEDAYLTLPPQAVDWPEPKIWIQGYGSLQLHAGPGGEAQRTWHWPKRMKSLFLGGNITDDFFTSFIEQNVVVTEEFGLQTHWPDFNCATLDEYSKRTEGMASEFTCQVFGDSGAASLITSRPLQAVLAAAFAFWFLL